MKYLLPALILFFSNSLFAQQDKAEPLKKDHLTYYSGNFTLFPKVFMNNERLKNKEQASVFSQVPESFQYYQQYKKRYSVGLYSMGGAFLGMIVSVLSFDSGNRPMAGAGMTVTILSIINGSTFFSSGDKKFRKAVNIYNAGL